MALNVDRTPDGRGIILFNGEIVLLFTKEVTLELQSAEPTVRGKRKGSLYLTSHRVVFTCKDAKDSFQSMSMPFHCLKNLTLEQPVLGANYINGKLLAQPNGNWSGEATIKLTFSQGGCIEFGQTLLHAVEIASAIRTTLAPPPYAPPPGGYFSPPPAYYTCQGTNFYGIQVPVTAFPNQPPPGSVYVYRSGPPYPGVFNPPPPNVDGHIPPGVVFGVPPPYSTVTGQPEWQSQNGSQNQKPQENPNVITDTKPPSYEDAVRRRHPPHS